MNKKIIRDDGILPFRACVEFRIVSMGKKPCKTIDYIEQKDIKKIVIAHGEKFIIHRGNKYKKYSVTHLNSGYGVSLECPFSSGIGTVEVFLEKKINEMDKSFFNKKIKKANAECKKIIASLKKQKGVIVYG